ncbi:dTMP kinase [Candidatus Protofrankia californiensis]|uniref:dTMP kinase n=1 Tax=Candidatus Protofrankia californiensis TaxID=1839754 RepID=UPI003D34A35F
MGPPVDGAYDPPRSPTSTAPSGGGGTSNGGHPPADSHPPPGARPPAPGAGDPAGATAATTGPPAPTTAGGRSWSNRPPGRPPVVTVPSPPAGPADPHRNTEGDIRAVLRIPQFRRLWLALTLSSLGDWMGLLATTALASSLQAGFSEKAYAIGSVLIVRLLPALIFGPLAGVVADRLDRRLTMVVADVLRFGLFVSIPLVGTLVWLLVASLLIECVSLFWNPAKDASVPNLVPVQRLATANTLSLITTYGSAPLAAAIFSLLATLSRTLASSVSFFKTSPLDLALYFNAVTFLVSAVVIFRLRGIGRAERHDAEVNPSFWSSITEGLRFVSHDRLVRGLVVGILGGFAGAGCVVALGRLYVQLLGGGDSAYGVLFGAVFVGLAAGMALGPRLLGDYSRSRLFGLSVTAAGVTMLLVAVVPNLVLACILVVFVGAFAGIAWVTGYTLLQAGVSDELRGRTFALVQSLVRIDLLLVLAAAPALVGLIGSHHVNLWGNLHVRTDGVTIVLLGGGLLAVAVGLFSYRQMDERSGVAVLPELWNALLGRRVVPGRPRHAGLFIALEGGEGSGKSTQAERLRSWLASSGREVVVTREPGGTALGTKLRELLLDPAARLHPRTEALLYAADRAEHVSRVIEPALARGAVVVSDRFVDSSIAYQGAGRQLGADDVAMLSRWATRSLVPDVTILLDIPAEVGLGRVRARAGMNSSVRDRVTGHEHGGAPGCGGTPDRNASGTRKAGGGDGPAPGIEAPGIDRIEAEQLSFHERVRDSFRQLAERAPDRYVVLDANCPPETVHSEIRNVVTEHLRQGREYDPVAPHPHARPAPDDPPALDTEPAVPAHPGLPPHRAVPEHPTHPPAAPSPAETSQATGPADPAGPTGPADPTGPAAPTDPAVPTDLADPADPSEGTEAGDAPDATGPADDPATVQGARQEAPCIQ